MVVLHSVKLAVNHIALVCGEPVHMHAAYHWWVMVAHHDYLGHTK